MNTNNSPLHSIEDQIVSAIQQLLTYKTPVLIAIDGRSGTGKSTLSQLVAGRVNGSVVVGDDFYSGGNDEVWYPLTAREKVEKVIDWRRMRTQVLEPLLASRPASWHPLAFQPEVGWAGWQDATIIVEPTPVIILDGVYSARPELSDLVDLAILVETSETLRRRRLILREGQDFMQRWHRIWDVAEDYYFTYICPPSAFAMIISNE